MKKKEFFLRISLVISSLLVSFIFLEISLRILGQLYLSGQNNENLRSILRERDNNTIVILALGESTTAFRGNDSWTLHLEQILNSRTQKKYIVINEGLPNTYTGAIVSRLPFYLDKYRPNLVITMMGVNDLKHAKINKLTKLSSRSPIFKLRIFSFIAWGIGPVLEYTPLEYNESRDITKQNYLLVNSILHKQNITYFAMNYPTLPIDIIKNLFYEDTDLVVISNENFNDALTKYNYSDLFIDSFPLYSDYGIFEGNFGHTTNLGNKLIAENAASSILLFYNITS